jgi:hypothetical protein
VVHYQCFYFLFYKRLELRPRSNLSYALKTKLSLLSISIPLFYIDIGFRNGLLSIGIKISTCEGDYLEELMETIYDMSIILWKPSSYFH